MQEIAQGYAGISSLHVSVQPTTSNPFYTGHSTCELRYRLYLRCSRRCSQSAVQRDHARHLLTLYGKGGPPVETDIQSAHAYTFLTPLSSQVDAVGITTLGIFGQEWK